MKAAVWTQSLRVRLAVLYSLLLLTLMSLVVAATYAMVARSVQDAPVSKKVAVTKTITRADGSTKPVTVAKYLPDFEAEVNERTLDRLRTVSLVSLGALALLSLGLGYVLAGRALRPVTRISAVAQEIEASQLSRRIALDGPRDELRELADTFDRMLARLDDAFEAQRRLVDDASHDLRNPLAVLRTNLEVVLRDPDATPEALRQACEVAARAVDRMTRTVEELLVTARRQAPELTFAPTDLHAVLAESATEFTVPAQLRDISLDVHADAACTVPADRVALRRSVANLVDNAVRLAPAGSRVLMACGRRNGWAWFAVSDEGPGIAAADQERVFDRAWSDVEGGSGLGLAIVRGVAEAHGGVIRLHSGVGRGSTFVVWLPTDPGRVTWAPPSDDPVAGLSPVGGS